jgi:hypothetical protein
MPRAGEDAALHDLSSLSGEIDGAQPLRKQVGPSNEVRPTLPKWPTMLSEALV